MHRPPATSFSVQPSWRFGIVLVCLSLLSWGAVAWAALVGFEQLRFAAVAVSGLLSLVALWMCWRKQPVGRLSWDGEQWQWSGSAAPLQAASIQFDFQSSLWVYLRTQDHRHIGLWLDEHPQQTAAWRALRRALVGSQEINSVHSAQQDSWLA
jgi:hypothetical protein